jgi:acetyl-CoA carboxylase, biotin carboxylase subunit
MFEKVLIANRGAAASRIIRALRKLGKRSVPAFSDVDRELPFVAEANHAFHLGRSPQARHSSLGVCHSPRRSHSSG